MFFKIWITCALFKRTFIDDIDIQEVKMNASFPLNASSLLGFRVGFLYFIDIHKTKDTKGVDY